MKEEPSPAKARALAAQITRRHMNEEEDEEVDTDAMNAFTTMIQAEQKRAR